MKEKNTLDCTLKETEKPGTEPALSSASTIPTRKPKTKTARFLIESFKTLLLVLVVAFSSWYVVPTFAAEKTEVDGDSMESNFHNGEHLMIDKLSYHLTGLHRFDVITFYPYPRKTSDTPLGLWERKSKGIQDDCYIKRIIGLPGETIQIKGADIYINGQVLEEDYGKMPITNPGLTVEPLTLAEDEYFVLGDNREISLDSRCLGPIKYDTIVGRYWFRY